MAARAIIVTPTLDVARAAATCAQAQRLAGFPCGIVIIGEETKRGAVIPMNAGVTAALAQNPDYIVHLNDDTRVGQDGWLARLVEAIESNPRYGLAAPSGPCRSDPQLRGRPGMEKGITVVEHPLANFCQVVKAEVIRQVGLYDTNLIHYSGESDFSMRARDLGWLEIWVQDVYVHHEVGEKTLDWWQHDRAYYKNKWRGR